jgi:purine-binding chemotaxis protein CheW
MTEDLNTEVIDRDVDTGGDLAGKYLTFRLAKEEYGIPILTVVEIIKKMEVTPVPRTPSFVRGVVNLRGQVIPVIELRGKFDMERIDDTDETCIIVVRVVAAGHDIELGVLIDSVSEVLDIASEQIEPPPEFGAACDTEFILGMAKSDNGVKILIDINRVLSAGEQAVVASCQ